MKLRLMCAALLLGAIAWGVSKHQRPEVLLANAMQPPTSSGRGESAEWEQKKAGDVSSETDRKAPPLSNERPDSLPGPWQCGACGWVDAELAYYPPVECMGCPPHNDKLKPHRWVSEVNAQDDDPRSIVIHRRWPRYLIDNAEGTVELDICLEHGETRVRRFK